MSLAEFFAQPGVYWAVLVGVNVGYAFETAGRRRFGWTLFYLGVALLALWLGGVRP